MATGQDQIRVSVSVDVADGGGQRLSAGQGEGLAEIAADERNQIGRLVARHEDVGHALQGENLHLRADVRYVLFVARDFGFRRVEIHGHRGAVLGRETVVASPVDLHFSARLAQHEIGKAVAVHIRRGQLRPPDVEVDPALALKAEVGGMEEAHLALGEQGQFQATVGVKVASGDPAAHGCGQLLLVALAPALG